MVKPTPAVLPFVEIWRRAVLASGLHPGTKLVAFGLAIHMNGNGSNARPGTRRLAEETHLSRDTVLRGRTELLETGWIELVTRGGTPRGGSRSANEYRGVIPDRSDPATGPIDAVVPVGSTRSYRSDTPTQGMKESKATRGMGESARFCGNCERGWIETPDGSFVRCQCLGGPVPSSSNGTDTLLDEIDELIAPPPPGLLRRDQKPPF